MYFTEQTIIQAIDLLSDVRHNFTKTTGNADLLSYYLILKKLGTSNSEWLNKDQIFNDKELIKLSLWQLGGMFSESETPDKRCCLFLSSFCKRNEIEAKYFNNQGTTFNNLTGRLKDTIDNSIVNYLLDKGPEDTYRFKVDVISRVKKNYMKPFPIAAVAVWVLRNLNFSHQLTIESILEIFINEFRLSPTEAREIFEYSNKPIIAYKSLIIDYSIIRDELNVSEIVEITSSMEVNKFNFNNHINQKKSLYSGYGMKNDFKKIESLLDRNKQVILTGVPGTGKSHTIEQISNNYKEVKKIQFHQNYTYQQFILGKTIKDGTVFIEEGDLLEFISKIRLDIDSKFLLVLDEINRGNISSIFGEALYALDRGNEIDIENGYKLSLPNNLHILGTMNTADRSIAIVDFAIRRRFLFIDLHPDYDLIDQLSKLDNEEVLGNFLKKINDKVLEYFENDDYLLGHAYFLGFENININDIYDVLHYRIIPILVEYSHGDKSSIANIFPEYLVHASSENLLEKIKLFINE